jgi:hypothetical protein
VEREGRVHNRSVVEVVMSAGLPAVVLGVTTGALLAASIATLNPELTLGDVALVGLHLTGLYTLINLVGLGAAAVLALVFGYRPGPRFFAGVGIGFWVLLNGALRHISAVQFLSVTPHVTAIGALDALVIAAAALLVTLGIARGGRRSTAMAIATALGLFVFLEGIHAWHERPLVRDLARDVPAAVSAHPGAPIVPAMERFDGARMVVLGFDGLSWEILLPLLQRGELPGFRALLADAAYGNLGTHPFTVSPLIWETISTGQPPRSHGIGHHVHFELKGLDRRLRHLPYYSLTNSPMALRKLMTTTSAIAPWEVLVADASDAKKARFWEVAQGAGVGVGLYDWLNTTPASAVQPFVWGSGSVPPRGFPPGLDEEFPPVQKLSFNDPGLEALDARLVYEQANYERFRRVAQRHRPALQLYYTHVGDAVNHLNWRDEVFGQNFFISGLRHPEFEPGPTVTRVMGFLDDIVRDVLSRLSDEAIVVLVSDHGFDLRGYEHDNAPPGVFVLRGPGVRPGPFEGATIYDVAPTLLQTLGLPVAEDMIGRPVDVASRGGPLDRSIARVPSYGASMRLLPAGPTDADDAESHLEYLRALGYIE